MSLILPTKLCWEHPVLDVFLKQKSTHNVKEEKKLWLLIKCVSETIERGCGFFTQVWSKKKILFQWLHGPKSFTVFSLQSN